MIAMSDVMRADRRQPRHVMAWTRLTRRRLVTSVMVTLVIEHVVLRRIMMMVMRHATPKTTIPVRALQASLLRILRGPPICSMTCCLSVMTMSERPLTWLWVPRAACATISPITGVARSTVFDLVTGANGAATTHAGSELANKLRPRHRGVSTGLQFAWRLRLMTIPVTTGSLLQLSSLILTRPLLPSHGVALSVGVGLEWRTMGPPWALSEAT